ncbi:MAG: hypothetical protein GMKNLPBB_02045 [Myxococcota bacterium]|nr:hypothetical protein [Myxococcota bacterium]
MLRTGTLISLWVVCAASLAGAPALAQDKQKVMMFPLQPVLQGTTEDNAGKLDEALQNECMNLPDVEVIPGPRPTATADAPATAEEDTGDADKVEAPNRSKEISKADKDLAAADKEFQKKKWGPARKLYKSAMDGYMSALDGLGDYANLKRALEGVAICYLRTAEDEKGEETFADLIRMDPEYKLDEQNNPPLYLTLYKKQRDKLLKSKRGVLQVTADIPDSTVIFNGKTIGAAPARLMDIIPGYHVLTVKSPKGHVWSQRVKVDAGAAANQDVKFAQAAAAPKPKAAPAKSGSPADMVFSSLRENKIDFETRNRVSGIAKAKGASWAIFGGVAANAQGLMVMQAYLLSTKDANIYAIKRGEVDRDMLNVTVQVFEIAEDIKAKLAAPGSPVGNAAIPVVKDAAAPASSAPVLGGPAAPGAAPAVLPSAPMVEYAVHPKPAEDAGAVGPMGPAAPAGMGPAMPVGPAVPAGPAGPAMPAGPAAQAPPAVQPGVQQPAGPPPGTFLPPGAGMPGSALGQAPRKGSYDELLGAGTVAPGAGQPGNIDEEWEYWYEKWWVWTIIGAVAVGGGVTTYVLTRPGPATTATATFSLQ